MELIERYLQAVEFWLPKAQRQDIIAELSEDIRAQVEERESELGRSLNEQEAEALRAQIKAKKHIFCSAKTQFNVKLVFDTAIKVVLNPKKGKKGCGSN
mgnify:CR=1 FL=1